jgi:hypothetical protein
MTLRHDAFFDEVTANRTVEAAASDDLSQQGERRWLGKKLHW